MILAAQEQCHQLLAHGDMSEPHLVEGGLHDMNERNDRVESE
jgi:hypothetical protein